MPPGTRKDSNETAENCEPEVTGPWPRPAKRVSFDCLPNSGILSDVRLIVLGFRSLREIPNLLVEIKATLRLRYDPGDNAVKHKWVDVLGFGFSSDLMPHIQILSSPLVRPLPFIAVASQYGVETRIPHSPRLQSHESNLPHYSLSE